MLEATKPPRSKVRETDHAEGTLEAYLFDLQDVHGRTLETVRFGDLVAYLRRTRASWLRWFEFQLIQPSPVSSPGRLALLALVWHDVERRIQYRANMRGQG